MAPPTPKRFSNGGTPSSQKQQQRPISSFFTPKPPPTTTTPPPPSSKSKPSISSFFTPKSAVTSTPTSTPMQTPLPASLKKPALVVGKPQGEDVISASPSPSPSPSPCPPLPPSAKRARTPRRPSAESPIESTPVENGEESPALRTAAESLVGRRLQVFWPSDNAWYAGTVAAFNASSGTHQVLYDDGEEETLTLENEKVQWLDRNPSPSGLKAMRIGRGRLKRLNGSGIGASASVQSQALMKDEAMENPIDSSPEVTPETQKKQRQSRKKEEAMETPVDPNPEASPEMRRSRQRQHRVSYADSGGDTDSDDDWDARAPMSEDSEEEEEDDLEPEDSLQDEETPRKAKKQPPSSNTKRKRGDFLASGDKRKRVQPADIPKSKDCKQNASSSPAGDGDRAVDDCITAANLSSKGGATIRDTITGLTGELADRFGSREEEKFKFLGKNRRDASGRCPSDLNYNPHTVFMPSSFLNGLSGGQRQWWEFKSKHMDKVILFKMGKFYEIFEMDAHIGAKELDLQYMKGEQPHCGFPEKNFTENAEKLARKGYRVLVVEQTETPDQLEKRRKETGTKDKVVKREICAVITKGTMTEGEMLAAIPDASYLMSVFEIYDKTESTGSSLLGLCLVDVSTDRFFLGQFVDDMARTCLRSVLSELRPVEVIKPRGALSEATEMALRDETRNPLVTDLAPDSEFWNCERTIDELTKLYKSLKLRMVTSKNDNESTDEFCMFPGLLRDLLKGCEKSEAVICALGGCISYLRQLLLERKLLSFGSFEILPGSDMLVGLIHPDNLMECKKEIARKSCLFCSSISTDTYMMLDSTALENLEILENNHDGSTSGTLLRQLDQCVTMFGRRLLKQWIVRPLFQKEAILQRQSAVKDFKGLATEAAGKFRKDLSRIPDMERLLTRLRANSDASGRNAQRVVFYEDASKKQLKEFIMALRGFQSINQVLAFFRENYATFTCVQLQKLLKPGGCMPCLDPLIDHFEAAFDWTEAESTGRIVPHKGVDEEYDLAFEAVSEVERNLKSYLQKQKKHFGNSSEIVYVTVGKERYQIEVPDSLQQKVPSDYEVRTSRKGFKRYWTPYVKEQLHNLVMSEEQKQTSMKGILHGMIKRFCENYNQWLEAIHIIAELDALISLAVASNSMVGSTCTPVISSSRLDSEESTPSLYAKGLRHPSLEGRLNGESPFVPNDIFLGGKDHPPFVLLTGPNMGGKSTLLRQVCLAAILAQIGADVPAETFRLSPIDRIFVRMGARDHIMSGQSTFLVELSETASMLRFATRKSLVALDELGRGTSTSDGQAIAHAVLEDLAHRTGCRGLFSTHYHRLATDHLKDSSVSLYHMACKVGACRGGLEEVTFLYKLTPGACPKSYGVNVARIAGMPEAVLQRAVARSAEIEILHNHFSAKKNNGKISDNCLLQQILQLVADPSLQENAVSNQNHLNYLRNKAQDLLCT